MLASSGQRPRICYPSHNTQHNPQQKERSQMSAMERLISKAAKSLSEALKPGFPVHCSLFGISLEVRSRASALNVPGWSGLVAQAFNPRIREAETDGSL